MLVRSAAGIGAAIRDRRKQLKLDQAQLASRIGATRQWLIAIEKGKDSAELGLVLRTLAALDLRLEVSVAEASAPAARKPAIDIDAIVASARNRARHGR